ncbi:MAG: carbohydrate-binding domain-containing protein [Oscillospiraceae bacterium]|nr:carbohydrate-binding domain-containing protein [Oscillospiraceae bacterium]
MKCRYTKLLPLALSAAMLFTGCAVRSADGTASDAASTATISQTAGSLDTIAAVTASDACGEAFSKRDLSGEYDEAGAVTIALNGAGASCDGEGVSISGSTVTITAAGTYVLSGTLDNGNVIVDAGKEDKVQLVLNGASIHANAYAALYVKQADKVFVTLADGTANTLAGGDVFTQLDENDVDAAVFAKDDITFNGTGTLQICAPAGHGISGKDEVTITGGVYEITAADCAIRAKDSIAVADGTFTLAAGSDGMHAENGDDDTLGNLYIAGGSFTIQASDDAVHANALLTIDGGTLNIIAAEGLEAAYIRINGGTINISASDDGINAARKSSAYTPTVEINGGEINIQMGAGDTDGVDSNGNIIINGGTISVTGQSTFDYDGSAEFNGGTIIVNGEQVDSIPNQMMGGPGGMTGGMGRGPGGPGGADGFGGMGKGPGGPGGTDGFGGTGRGPGAPGNAGGSGES